MVDPKYDVDKNGAMSETEIKKAKEIIDIDILEQKAKTQKRMAWTAMWSMIIATAILFSPIVKDSRVSSLSDLLGLFYIAQAGIVGAYMGVTTWLSSKTIDKKQDYLRVEE